MSDEIELTEEQEDSLDAAWQRRYQELQQMTPEQLQQYKHDKNERMKSLDKSGKS